ncbi:DUF2218 domain-containing protein [Acinetobacter sp. YH12219]|uniref:DUF2218 domain-containing protein n=1 Tax=Acinetobacter sp. YH12219 TaxID=2601153 RepID=UPI0015D296CC|nr:DUF2218 domain-containing protein [Acinetobacter sp. YH12219]
MKSSTQITTTQAARVAKRLVNHWKHKFEVNEQLIGENTAFKIQLPSAEVSLLPQAAFLDVVISAQDPSTNLDQLEHVVLDHLIRMGQEELSATWQREP